MKALAVSVIALGLISIPNVFADGEKVLQVGVTTDATTTSPSDIESELFSEINTGLIWIVSRQ